MTEVWERMELIRRWMKDLEECKMQRVTRNYIKLWALTLIRQVRPTIIFLRWLARGSWIPIRLTSPRGACMPKPSCHGSQVATSILKVQVRHRPPTTLHKPIDPSQMLNSALVTPRDSPFHRVWKDCISKYHINTRQLRMDWLLAISEGTILIKRVWAMARRVISQIRRKSHKYREQSTTNMKLILLVTRAGRIIRGRPLVSTINMTNGKKLATRVWSNIFICVKRRDQARIWSKNSFICHQLKGRHSSRYPRQTVAF